MRDFIYRVVERLHGSGGQARPLSRNKHFHVFSGETYRALRIDRHLRDLEQHLAQLRAAGERPRVRALPDGGVQLVLRHPSLPVVRTATLAAEEVALLQRHPAGAWALEEARPAGTAVQRVR
jgi:hypothetical protein